MQSAWSVRFQDVPSNVTSVHMSGPWSLPPVSFEAGKYTIWYFTQAVVGLSRSVDAERTNDRDSLIKLVGPLHRGGRGRQLARSADRHGPGRRFLSVRTVARPVLGAGAKMNEPNVLAVAKRSEEVDGRHEVFVPRVDVCVRRGMTS